MIRTNTSRQTISAKQRLSNYRPSSVPAAHVAQETRYINSTSTILHTADGYYVRSKKFDHLSLYYSVTVDEQGQWSTSSHDERFAKKLVEQVKQYLAEKAA